MDPDNIGVVVPDIIAWLSETDGYSNSFVYSTVKSHVNNENQAKSYALRLLIHYLGDIHQPLHATSRVDEKYPKGDAGGNFFRIEPKDTAKNLHSVWDSVVFAYADTPSLVTLLISNTYAALQLIRLEQTRRRCQHPLLQVHI